MKNSMIILLVVVSGCSWAPRDKWLLAGSAVAAFADYKSTVDLLDRGGHENLSAWAVGKYPSDGRLAVWMISTQGLTILAAWIFPKWRTAILGGKTAINSGCAIYNNQLEGAR